MAPPRSCYRVTTTATSLGPGRWLFGFRTRQPNQIGAPDFDRCGGGLSAGEGRAAKSPPICESTLRYQGLIQDF
ncbi:unnamed protein product [Miscanthus lutarioriparius]|uniref:Uncharacterized protein n=1 Tax=Miscanthus lutarioriparius TaxID=422564 RepID=A0A811RMY1_9POAL|nr:unnamed protein product [Miscanthus lutarioriparius]